MLRNSSPIFNLAFRQLSTTSSLGARTGFIGLGNMGLSMARNLMHKGHTVVAYDVSSEALDAAVAAGASKASSPAELASQSDIVLTMLPTGKHVKEVYTDPKSGLLASARSDHLFIDSSTIDPSASNELANLTKEKKAVFIDAPVSGGVVGAAAGTLTFMVGAEDPKHFELAKPVLEAMGKLIVHTGVVGMGQATKICNNMMLAISMIGVSETINLGINLGLDPKMLTEVMCSSTSRCWVVDTYNPVPGIKSNVPSSNDYKGGFSTSLITKDLGLAQNAATNTHSATPLGSMAHQMYRVLCEHGYGDKDFAYTFQFLKKTDKSE